MLILERIISVIAPHTCLGCGVENDALLCGACRESLAPVPSRCYKCRAATQNYQVCKRCRRTTPLFSVFVGYPHADLAKALVHRAKYERAQSGLAEMAQLLATVTRDVDESALFTHVPTASSRVRMRGYDHALLLARHLCGVSHRNRRTLLVRVGQAHQVGSSRSQRLRQLQGAFRAVRASDIRGRHVVLVDDVLTTGATLEMAARELKRAGAKRVSAIVFAQA